MAKRLDSPYEPGRRSGAWIKVKNRPSQDVVVGGWLPGEGSRASSAGRARRGRPRGGGPDVRRARSAPASPRPRSRRRCGSSSRCERDESPFAGRQPPKGTLFVEPRLVARVEFAEWTRTGTLRAPSFKGLRDDVEPEDVGARGGPAAVDASGLAPPLRAALGYRAVHGTRHLERGDLLRPREHPREALQRRQQEDGPLPPARLQRTTRASSRSA